MAGTASTNIRSAPRARHRVIAGVCALGLAAATALAGCSGDSSDSASTSGGKGMAGPAAAPAEQAGAAGAADKAAAPEAQGKDTAARGPDLRLDQRSIVYTGSITVQVQNVNIAAAKVTGIVTGAGGFIGGDKRSSSGQDGPSDATLTLRVPADKFTSVVDQLAGLGHEEQRGINTEDVTEETVDLDARIATQQARVASGRKLLAQAKSLEDLVMLEREVATRESDLASLEAKKRRLADLTALSTITVVLLDPDAATTKAADDGPPGFLTGLENGWNGLLASLGVVATVLGWLLPWLLLLGLPAWAVVWYVRRNRRPAPKPADQQT
ncbi:DUF4349 domain-containing protein [Actinoplanes sp. NPDC051475]|uniref:DUF4349 domain-containing protein n=1 Tax=Actinoplanes sp. NPDC051475 TaxID=3157225 RepID=UPI00344B8264